MGYLRCKTIGVIMRSHEDDDDTEDRKITKEQPRFGERFYIMLDSKRV